MPQSAAPINRDCSHLLIKYDGSRYHDGPKKSTGYYRLVRENDRGCMENPETRVYMKKPRNFKRLWVCGLHFFLLGTPMPPTFSAEPPPIFCPPGGAEKPKPRTKLEVYQGVPYQAGEEAHYIAYWAGIHAGDHTMTVLPPVLQEGEWLQAFRSDAITGEWFKHIYVAHYLTNAHSYSTSFGASWFHGSEYRKPPLVADFKEEKTLVFAQEDCKAHEEIQTNKKPLEQVAHGWDPTATDVLSGVYKLRTLSYTPNQPVHFLIYSSGKNWKLEATPLGKEMLTLPIGNIEGMKLKLLTYMGRELQQKGDLFIWIATTHPQHPMLQMEGKLKWGSVRMLLDRFTPGKG